MKKTSGKPGNAGSEIHIQRDLHPTWQPHSVGQSHTNDHVNSPQLFQKLEMPGYTPLVPRLRMWAACTCSGHGSTIEDRLCQRKPSRICAWPPFATIYYGRMVPVIVLGLHLPAEGVQRRVEQLKESAVGPNVPWRLGVADNLDTQGHNVERGKVLLQDGLHAIPVAHLGHCALLRCRSNRTTAVDYCFTASGVPAQALQTAPPLRSSPSDLCLRDTKRLC